jgi:hypothetical protein
VEGKISECVSNCTKSISELEEFLKQNFKRENKAEENKESLNKIVILEEYINEIANKEQKEKEIVLNKVKIYIFK